MNPQARSDYMPNLSSIGNFINVHSDNDWVQTHAGGKYSVTGILGSILLGPIGKSIGNWIGLGEFGPSGRYQSGSDYEVDVTDIVNAGWLKSHTNTFRNSNVFQQRIVPLLKK